MTYQSKEIRIHIYHCDRCKEKIFEGNQDRQFPDRMNSWPVTLENHLGHRQTFHIKIETKEQNRSTNRENDSHFCIDCALTIIKTAMSEGEFSYDPTLSD